MQVWIEKSQAHLKLVWVTWTFQKIERLLKKLNVDGVISLNKVELHTLGKYKNFTTLFS